jgi:16S rRNA (cytidine1402-2'-O)-methyltransferase
MEDITLRALRILRGVDLIACEDTRTTGNLLKHHGINARLISHFSRNERQRVPQLVDLLLSDQSIAVVSDAGTPSISDPAAMLVSAAITHGVRVIPIPGPSASLAALVVSGFHTDRFHFEGFLPIKKRRKARIEELALETRTIILYESVHRLQKTLRELSPVFGARRISISREITKMFEQTIRGTIPEMIAYFEEHTPRGEFVLVLEGRSKGEEMRGEDLEGAED